MTDLLQTGVVANGGQETQVDRQIAHLRLELVGAETTDQVREIRDRIFFAEQSRWTVAPVGGLASRPQQAIPLDDIRHLIPRDELLLEYVLSDPHSYCLVIGHDSAQIVQLNGRHDIESAVSSYLKTIRSKETSTTFGRELFAMLFKPVPEIEKKSRLMIVRDGQLHLLPFDALINSGGRYVAQT